MSNGETRGRCGTAAVVVLALAGSPAWAQSPDEPIPLAEGRTLTASHSADERFVYALEAEAGADYLVTVEQRGFDLIVEVEVPGGAVRTLNSPLLRDEREVVLLEDAAPGRHLVRLRSEEHTGAAGGHSIDVTRVESAPSEAVSAWREMTRGARLSFEGGAEAWSDAAEAYDSAAAHFRALGSERELAHALFAAATVEYWQLYDWTRSADLAAEAAALYDALGEATLSANAAHLQAAALVESALEAGNAADGASAAEALFDEALALLERARQTHEQLGNLYDLGLVLNNFGYTHFNRGDFAGAAEYWQQAATVMRSASEWSGELTPIANLAAIDAEEGRAASAIDSFERILEILPPGKQELYRADVLDNLGMTRIIFGDLEPALAAFTSALEIQGAIDDLQGRGRSLRGIGRAYYGLGQLDLAKTYLGDALWIARETHDGRNQEAILRELGNIAFFEEDYESALELHRAALDIVQSATDRAYLELLVAKDLIALGRHEEALETAGAAREEAERLGSDLLLAEALHRFGGAVAELPSGGDPTAPLEQAAGIYERLNLQAQHAEVLHTLALASRDRGDLERAVEHGDAALDRLEDLRLRVASPELRAFFSSVRREYYENQIALLMALDARDGFDSPYARAALEASERSRARMIADLLQEASVDLHLGDEPELERRQAELYERLAELGQERDRLAEEAAGAPGAEVLLGRALTEIASIENELNLLEIELRKASPEFASLKPASPLGLTRIQALLDADSVLLQYAFAETSAYAWVVTRDDVAGIHLGDRHKIETAARRVIEGLEAYSPDRAARAELDAHLDALAALVLAPIRERLEAVERSGAARLVLSLDGVLQYVPFSALPLVQADGSRERLIERHAIVHVPSMSALAALRRRAGAENAPKTLAIFADPVLGAADPRLAGRPAPGGAVEPQLAMATRAALGTDLQRLPSTAFEAEAIAALVPDQQRFVARGFAASRDAVLGMDLAEYRYLHFATHGLVDSRYPALSALALSQFDSTGAPRDGLLRLGDIYNLELNADVVVLSACETALGREVRGEGLLGLSQGFLYAGARSLIVSLWQVPDRATSELMTSFYSFMLNDGLEPAEALRRAQLASAAQRRWSDPYFWAGFVLLGDWQ